jgi:hypothetical protein
VILFLGSVLCAFGEAMAKEYYVSPQGDDSSPGTSVQQPLRTINKAAQVAEAGDVVDILAGQYVERIRPTASGTADAPVTYRKAGSGEVVITTSKESDGGRWEERFAFKLGAGNDYTVIDGLTFRDAEAWIYVGDYAHHNTIRNCTFDGNRMYHGIYINSGSWTQILSCKFLRALPIPENWESTQSELPLADYVSIWGDSHHNLIDGCEFHKISHVGVMIIGHDPGYTATHNIVRNSTFNDPQWKCVSFHASRYTLVENCTMWGRGAAFFQYQGSDAIVRRNIIKHYRAAKTPQIPADYHGALWLRSVVNEYGGIDDARNGRIYNNVFYGGDKAITYGASRTALPVCENVFKNNIFYKNNEPLRLPRPFFANWTTQNATYFLNNVILAAQPAEKVIEYVTTDERLQLTLAEATARSKELCKAQLFEGNLEVAPGFADEAADDFHLAAGSPCIDAGADLTRTVEAGRGRDVIVEDARYFCDGYGLIEGDQIVVGQNQPVRVVKADWAERLLRVDREITWKKGDAVNLPYAGKRPDIGAYEFGAQ